jgi:hypothetical protein
MRAVTRFESHAELNISFSAKVEQQTNTPFQRLPYDSSPFISSPVISSRSFRPLVILSPVISSLGHLVPWSFRPLLSHHPIQFHMCKIIQFHICKIIKFHMCKIILKIWYVFTSHIYPNLRSLITLYSNYIYSNTCVTVVTLHMSPLSHDIP